MHKQLFLRQHEMYITVSHNRDFAELQMSWQDYLTCGAMLGFLLNSLVPLPYVFMFTKL